MLHRRQDCPKADLWPEPQVRSEDDDLDGEHEQHRECLEEYGNSSVYFGQGISSFTGDTRTFMFAMFEDGLYDSNEDYAGIYMQVCQVFSCPFCKQDL